MDSLDHLRQEAQCITAQLCFLIDVHFKSLVKEVDQKFHRVVHIPHLEKFLLTLHVEEDLADQNPKRKVQNSIVKSLEVESEVGVEDAVEEFEEGFDLDEVDELVFEVLGAGLHRCEEVLEHGEVVFVELAD